MGFCNSIYFQIYSPHFYLLLNCRKGTLAAKAAGFFPFLENLGKQSSENFFVSQPGIGGQKNQLGLLKFFSSKMDGGFSLNSQSEIALIAQRIVVTNLEL